MDGNPIAQIILQIILIGLNAIFACAEIAVISFNDTKLAKLAAEGNKRAVRLARLTSQPARFLATIQVAITLSGFLGSAFAADNFASMLSKALTGLNLPISPRTLNNVAVVVITLILSYFTLIFGELVPKRVAMKNAEKLALAVSGLVTFISVVFKPIVSLLTASTNGIMRLLGIDPNSEDEEVTEENIRLMVDAGSETGAIDEEEKKMIQNVFEFDDITAGEIATHRTELCLLWTDETIEQWDETITEVRHSIYPICDETVDNVVGVLSAKDYFRLKDKSRESILKNAVQPPYFVPEHIKADVLFKNMKARRLHFAIVADEYGGVQGVVTMNDLIEQLIGSFEGDDLLDDEPEIEPLGEGSWRVLGTAPIEDVAERLGVTLPENEYETFGGFVFTELGSVPDDGSSLELTARGLHVRDIEIHEHRLVRATVDVVAAPEGEKDGDEA